jgi:hypothetical protein
MSDNENGSEYQEDLDYEEPPVIEKQSKNCKKFEIGNGNLHFLPVKISHSGHSRVDVFFDSLIENRSGKNIGYDYTTSFRGRVFNGKKVLLTDENKLHHLRTNKEGNEFTICSSKEVPEFYIWKFDEGINSDNNLLSISSILTDLKVLK